jgi:hypothetical protein
MKYRIQRDGLSMTITASSREEAELDFCARLAQKVEWLKGEEVKSPRLPVRTTREIQAEAMKPSALAVKRQTKGIRG